MRIVYIMKLVFLLTVLVNGNVQRSQPIYFEDLRKCTHYARMLTHQGKRYHPIGQRNVKAYCSPKWVTKATKSF